MNLTACTIGWLLAALGIASILPAGAAEHADMAPAARGAELLKPFKHDLKTALQAGLADGPVAAIEVCRVRAPVIAEALSDDRIEVGRSSHRLRNPANAPAPWMEPVIADYVAGAPLEPRLVRLDDDRIGYVEPIVTAEMCLVCHGERLPPDLQRSLAERYPQDRATGFSAGDFRGIFWATFPD